MLTFKVYTKWTGYSEYTVKANSKEEAEELCMCGSFDTERHTLSGLDYGFEDEEVLKVEEVSNV